MVGPCSLHTIFFATCAAATVWQMVAAEKPTLQHSHQEEKCQQYLTEDSGDLITGRSHETTLQCEEKLQETSWLQRALHIDRIQKKKIARHPVAECDAEVGAGRLEKYKNNSGDEFCRSARSSFRCVADWKENNHEKASASDYLCYGKNMRLTFQSGSSIRLQGEHDDCQWTLPEKGLQLDFFLFDNFTVPLELARSSGHAREEACSETIQGPLLLYSEQDYWNPYLAQAQALMAYISVEALDFDISSLRVLFTDTPVTEQKDGRINPMYNLVTSLFSQGGASVQSEPQPRSICAKHVIVPPGGKASFIRKNAGWDDPWAAKCTRAPLLLGYANFLLEALHVNKAELPKERVVLLVRRRSPVHPDPYTREMTNPDELEKKLHDLPELSLLQEGSELRVRAVEVALASKLRDTGREVVEASPELLDVREQAELFAHADVIISAHSAALSWMLVAPECSQVLEFCAFGNYQFVNYAKLVGLHHSCVPDVELEWGTESFEAPVGVRVAILHRRALQGAIFQ
eukprot:TRINITY_DN7946_c0_g1_i1.p1 TRINITY_DN7946_c0_g1~~TRINITY_DN7946_c0_g1_i1.p1  ORF type:complete len:518 (-),score=97.38 TRINITY_DN7946_c0_g1_i1:70-1623(-)